MDYTDAYGRDDLYNFCPLHGKYGWGEPKEQRKCISCEHGLEPSEEPYRTQYLARKASVKETARIIWAAQYTEGAWFEYADQFEDEFDKWYAKRKH